MSELGCTYLQLDDTSLAYVNDPAQREHIVAIGGDPQHLHETYIANINRALAGRPDGIAVTTHMCRGNARSMWAAEGGYDFVAEALFNDLEVDGFFLEYDDARYVDIDQLCLSPQCGFSSTIEGNRLTIDEEVAKLRLVVETAEEVWGPA